MDKKMYSTDLTDKQWQVIEKLVTGKVRKRKHSLRSSLNGIFYLVKTGCQWRMLPSNFAPWNTVYYYCRKWKHEGLIEELHEMPRNFIRQKSGRSLSPGLGLIDSRSVKTSRNGGLERGIDGGKKTKGRKQHIITDTMGFVLTVVIHAANLHDSKAAFSVIKTEGYVASQRTARLNIFGMIDRKNHYERFTSTESITADKIFSFIDAFSFRVQKNTFVVLDNATIHRNHKIRELHPVWEKRGLFLFFLPPYSPHLNIAETLWRILKGKWIRPQDYVSTDTLFYTTNRALQAVGKRLFI